MLIPFMRACLRVHGDEEPCDYCDSLPKSRLIAAESVTPSPSQRYGPCRYHGLRTPCHCNPLPD